MYVLNRDKAVEAVIDIIAKQDNDVLQGIYYRAERPLTQPTILKVWNKLESPDALSDEELDKLLKICLEICKTDDYKNYLDEVDTSPLKKRYLNTITGEKSRVAAVQYLELFTELIESVFNKDLCQLSFDEAIEGLSSLPNLNASSLRKALTVARGYCAWCQDNGEFNEKAKNSFKNIKPEDIPIEPWIKGHIMKDAVDLSSRIEQTIPTNKGYTAPIISVLSWMGFDINVCPQLKIKDVNIFEKTICSKIIPDELTHIVLAYINETSDDNDDAPLLKKRGRGKAKYNPLNVADIRNALHILDGLTYNNIKTSSLLFELYHKKKKNGVISSEDYIEAFDLKPNTTAFLMYLKDKKRLYKAYENVYWE